MIYVKQFDEWNSVKKSLHASAPSVHIRVGEIRWFSCGVNVGSEIDGKGQQFTRPALILGIISSRLALVVPLSSNVRSIPGYFPFYWKGKTQSLCINQIRIISQKRIFGRIGRTTGVRLSEIKNHLRNFFNI